MRLVVVALLSGAALSSAACHTLRPVTLGELGVARPGTVWVTRADDTFVVVDGPRAFGDTLVGMVNGQLEEMPATELKKVRMIEQTKWISFLEYVHVQSNTATCISMPPAQEPCAGMLSCLLVAPT